jgi:hypothetical protein
MSFTQILWLTLAYCAEVNASEIPLKGTQMYSTSGLATASHRSINTIHPWHKILNSGGIISNDEKFHELRGSQPSTHLDMKSVKFTERIKSVLDQTGLEHLEQCTSYLTQEDMGIKNIKLKNKLLHEIEKYKEIEIKARRPSKSACKEFFTLILN